MKRTPTQQVSVLWTEGAGVATPLTQSNNGTVNTVSSKGPTAPGHCVDSPGS